MPNRPDADAAWAGPADFCAELDDDNEKPAPLPRTPDVVVGIIIPVDGLIFMVILGRFHIEYEVRACPSDMTPFWGYVGPILPGARQRSLNGSARISARILRRRREKIDS